VGRFLRDILSFSRTELRLVLIFSVVLFIVILARIFSGIRSSGDYSLSETEVKLINDFLRSLEEQDSTNRSATPGPDREYFSGIRKFNPNDVRPEEMREMGFPDRIISNLSKYRMKGGQFSTPTEFRKIYGITDSIFSLVLPYIIVDERSPADKGQSNGTESARINISTADSAELVSINGIGPVFAARIIKYRKLLGGYCRIDQLLEVYGMDSARFEQIRPYLYADSAHLRKIRINCTTVTELRRHPYIDLNTAKSIMNYRDYRNHIANIAEFDSFRVVRTEILEKVRPYLTAEP